MATALRCPCLGWFGVVGGWGGRAWETVLALGVALLGCAVLAGLGLAATWLLGR